MLQKMFDPELYTFPEKRFCRKRRPGIFGIEFMIHGVESQEERRSVEWARKATTKDLLRDYEENSKVHVYSAKNSVGFDVPMG